MIDGKEDIKLADFGGAMTLNSDGSAPSVKEQSGIFTKYWCDR